MFNQGILVDLVDETQVENQLEIQDFQYLEDMDDTTSLNDSRSIKKGRESVSSKLKMMTAIPSDCLTVDLLCTDKTDPKQAQFYSFQEDTEIKRIPSKSFAYSTQDTKNLSKLDTTFNNSNTMEKSSTGSSMSQ